MPKDRQISCVLTFREQKNTVNSDVFGTSRAKNHSIYDALGPWTKLFTHIYSVFSTPPSKKNVFTQFSACLPEIVFLGESCKDIDIYSVLAFGMHQKRRREFTKKSPTRHYLAASPFLSHVVRILDPRNPQIPMEGILGRVGGRR